MATNIKNLAKVKVSTLYGASDVSVVVAAGKGASLPAAPFFAVWWNSSDYADPADDPFAEVINVTAKSGDILTVTRGQGDTVASAKNLAGKTYIVANTISTDVVNAKLDKPVAGHAWRSKNGVLQLWNQQSAGGAGAYHSIWIDGTGSDLAVIIGPEDLTGFE